MPVKVLVNGAFGRMGQFTTEAIKAHPQLELVGQTGRDYDLSDSIKDSNADVVVDFTHASVVYENTRTILEAGARPVIGTSGLQAAQVNELQKLAKEKKLGGVIAPNFSLGGVLMMKHAKEIAKYMPRVEIIELHHDGKLDSPSGTAMRTAEMLAEVTENAVTTAETHSSLEGARGANLKNIPIHSIRLPGFLAHQEIIFGQPGEILTLRHDSTNRECFMPGVCLACEKAVDLDQLVYGLEEIL